MIGVGVIVLVGEVIWVGVLDGWYMSGVMSAVISALFGLTGVGDGRIVTAALGTLTVGCIPLPAMLQPAANTRKMNRIRIK